MVSSLLSVPPDGAVPIGLRRADAADCRDCEGEGSLSRERGPKRSLVAVLHSDMASRSVLVCLAMSIWADDTRKSIRDTNRFSLSYLTCFRGERSLREIAAVSKCQSHINASFRQSLARRRLRYIHPCGPGFRIVAALSESDMTQKAIVKRP